MRYKIIPIPAKEFDELTSRSSLKDLIGFPVYYREGDPTKVWPKPDEQFKNIVYEILG